MFKALVEGGLAVVAADMLGPMLPAVIDTTAANLPVRKVLAALAGAYAGGFAVHKSAPSLGTAAVNALAAFVGAEIVTKVSPIEQKIGPVAVVRTLGGGLGVWAADKVMHKKE